MGGLIAAVGVLDAQGEDPPQRDFPRLSLWPYSASLAGVVSWASTARGCDLAFAARLSSLLVGVSFGAIGCLTVLEARAQYATASAPAEVDTALVVSADVSNSVDVHRYQLQLEGIAAALEDPDVQSAFLTGPKGAILFMMVTWADRPQVSVPWTKIKSKADALALAEQVRRIPRHGGEFTCLSKMLRFVSDKVVTQVPSKASRIVVDVSGDGSDNCNPEEPPGVVRDELVQSNVIINGLPILEGREAATLAPWYTQHVMGGAGSFVLPAEGFGDFGRAIKQKFTIEVSNVELPSKRPAPAEPPTRIGDVRPSQAGRRDGEITRNGDDGDALRTHNRTASSRGTGPSGAVE